MRLEMYANRKKNDSPAAQTSNMMVTLFVDIRLGLRMRVAQNARLRGVTDLSKRIEVRIKRRVVTLSFSILS